MSDTISDDSAGDHIAQEAAAWVLRSDRGLSAAEQDEFSAWLAADPRHGRQLARHRQHWRRLDRLGQWLPEHSEQPNPDLLAPPLRHRMRAALPWALSPVQWQRNFAARGCERQRVEHTGRPLAGARSYTSRYLAVAILAAAAGIALTFFIRQPDATPLAPSAMPIAATTLAASSGTRVLDDGTTVELNQGAELTVQFTDHERRVRLDRGEAHFFVTKNPARPFVVNAGGVDVRAVGTAFNVRIDAAAVEVLVTEGRVAVARSATEIPAATPVPAPPVLEARQRAVVSRQTPTEPLQIATLTAGEIERVLAWQHRLLDFNAAPLNAIVAEFNRRNVVQLVVTDPELASVRISAAFRSENIDGFVRLLEAGFGVSAERRGDFEIVLRKLPK